MARRVIAKRYSPEEQRRREQQSKLRRHQAVGIAILVELALVASVGAIVLAAPLFYDDTQTTGVIWARAVGLGLGVLGSLAALSTLWWFLLLRRLAWADRG